MTFKQYVLFLSIGMATALTAWFIVLFVMDPVTAGALGIFTFFLTLFITLVGVFTLCGTLLRVLVIHRDGVISREVAHAFRQALLFSFILIIALILSSVRQLHWWSLLLVTLFFSGIELFFLSLRPHHERAHGHTHHLSEDV